MGSATLFPNRSSTNLITYLNYLNSTLFLENVAIYNSKIHEVNTFQRILTCRLLFHSYSCTSSVVRGGTQQQKKKPNQRKPRNF